MTARKLTIIAAVYLIVAILVWGWLLVQQRLVSHPEPLRQIHLISLSEVVAGRPGP